MEIPAQDSPDARSAAVGIDLVAFWMGPIVLAAPVAIGILYGALAVVEYMSS